jgi:hypothetical protein
VLCLAETRPSSCYFFFRERDEGHCRNLFTGWFKKLYTYCTYAVLHSYQTTFGGSCKGSSDWLWFNLKSHWLETQS